jgi:transposase-like protein
MLRHRAAHSRARWQLGICARQIHAWRRGQLEQHGTGGPRRAKRPEPSVKRTVAKNPDAID